MARWVLCICVILSVVGYGAPIPQIFADTYEFCELRIAGKNVSVPDKLWNVTNRDFSLFFSLCKSVQTRCGNQSSSCLVFRQSNERIAFPSEFSPGEEDSTLVSESRKRCHSNPAKNYTLSLSLQCSVSMKHKPRLMPFEDEDECTFEVIMMRPDCRPKCTELIANAYLLDFRAMKQPLQVQAGSKKFSLTLCGLNPKCSNDVTACEILQDNTTPLASLESQHFSYDVAKNALTARGRYKQGRVVRDVEVLIKCKWETELNNATYKTVQTQGRHYRFEVESSYGCLKFPQHCGVSSIDNLHYNLSGLYKEGGWVVAGVPRGRIVMNICGPLKDLQGSCADQHSQVCQSQQNKYTNRGSILLPLQASDDVVKATFVSGSRCPENPQLTYSTQITFKCARQEKGPAFTEMRGCVTFLSWETPRACPVDLYRSQNCYMNDRVANRNLQALHTVTDKVYPLTTDQKTKIVYNLCGPIHQSCGGFENVSFCLKSPGRDVIVGWESKELISENGRLRMELQGSVCPNRGTTPGVVVGFICSYQTPSPPSEIRVIEDGCKYNVTIFTPLACFSESGFNNCTYSTTNQTYDLSSLRQKNTNHVIRHGDVDVSFNLCGPIITQPGAFCQGDTMVCWYNRTELNIKHRYKSLGGVGRPRLHNGHLVVEAEMGAFCHRLGYYKSVIHFECADRRFPPAFLSKNECVYDFVWKTPEACPRDRNCIVQGAKPDATLDLTNLHQKTVVLNVDNATARYEFHLCTDEYTKSSNGSTSTDSLKRHYFSDTKNDFLVLDLQRICSNTSAVTKVIVKIQCAMVAKDEYLRTSFANCVLNMTLRTRMACSSKELPLSYEVVTRPAAIIPQKLDQCRVVNPQMGYEFSLNSLKSEEITFNRSRFAINLDASLSNCGGILCKNNTKLVGNICPAVSFDYSNRRVILHYLSTITCPQNKSYTLEMMLNCNDSNHGPEILKADGCGTTISYNLPEACLILKQDIIVTAGHTKAAVIGGSLTAVVILIGLAIFAYIYKRRCRDYLELMPFSRDKSAVPIYVRDFTQ